MKKNKKDLQVAVFGLGRFGMSIVQTLYDYDVNILACDKNINRLHDASDYATHVIQADAADEDALKKLAIGSFDIAIFAMGENFEATIMAAMTAKDLGTKTIVARAYDNRQKRILENLGVHRVILPETEFGEKFAKQLMQPNLLDILEESGHSVAEMHPMDDWVGKSIARSKIRSEYGYIILALIRGAETILPVMSDTILQKEDVLITLIKSK